MVEGGLAGSRNKADRATRGVLSALLALEALVVLLVPRAIAQTDTGLDTTKTVILVVLAVVLLMTAFLMRRRWAVGLGSALQVAVLATGVLEVGDGDRRAGVHRAVGMGADDAPRLGAHPRRPAHARVLT